MFYDTPIQGNGGPTIVGGVSAGFGINPLYNPFTVSRCVVNADINLPHIILPIGVGDGGLLNAPHSPTSNGDVVPPVRTVTPDVGDTYGAGGGKGVHVTAAQYFTV